MPNVARIYDYLIGGVSNSVADRAAAERVLAYLPQQRVSAIENRHFLYRAVRYLAAEAGVTQFLDIGMGLPTKRAVHEVARWANPASRVAYVDFDPVVVSHGKAMLVERDCSVVVQADLRDPEGLLADPEIRAHLDFRRPVGLLLVNIVHWLSDVDSPRRVVSVLRDAVAPGSYLVLTHVSMDLVADKAAAERARQVFDHANAQLRPRSRVEVMRLFNGWTLIEPGLVPKYQWRPDPGSPPATFDVAYAGVAKKLFLPNGPCLLVPAKPICARVARTRLRNRPRPPPRGNEQKPMERHHGRAARHAGHPSRWRLRQPVPRWQLQTGR